MVIDSATKLLQIIFSTLLELLKKTNRNGLKRWNSFYANLSCRFYLESSPLSLAVFVCSCACVYVCIQFA